MSSVLPSILILAAIVYIVYISFSVMMDVIRYWNRIDWYYVLFFVIFVGLVGWSFVVVMTDIWSG